MKRSDLSFHAIPRSQEKTSLEEICRKAYKEFAITRDTMICIKEHFKIRTFENSYGLLGDKRYTVKRSIFKVGCDDL